jgi:hypothetical protein
MPQLRVRVQDRVALICQREARPSSFGTVNPSAGNKVAHHIEICIAAGHLETYVQSPIGNHGIMIGSKRS